MAAVDEKPIKKDKAGTEQTLLTKPGQRYATPTPGVAERIFYETLYFQQPDSPMAQEYCVLYGILPEEEAARVYKKVQARKAGGKSGFSPSPARPKQKSKISGGGATKKKARLDDDADVDTGLAESTIYEGVGTGGF